MEENRYMAKMRVHELAKELNIKSQDVIDTLNGTQFAVKNVQSGLEDEAQQIVRKKYAKTEVKKDAPKKEETKKDEAKVLASTVLLELIDTAPIIIANATTPAACPNFNLFFI